MPSKKLSVLFTSSWYPSEKDPVLGNFVKRHAEAVATLHDTWAVYVTSVPPGFEGNYVRFYEENGVKTFRCFYTRGWVPAFNRWLALRKSIKWIKKKKGNGFDVVHHSMIWPDGWQPWWLRMMWGTPFIVSENWTGFDTDERGYPGWIPVNASRLFGKSASFLCPVTDNLARSMQKLGIKKNSPGDYRIVPNVVDTNLFNLAPYPATSTFRFFHLSSLLDQHKNISGLLQSFARALKHNGNLHLTIAGDGNSAPHIELAKKLDIPEASIRFLGTQTSAQVVKLMHESHAFVLFSNYENLPCVILEAMSCGRPVIATDVGGVREHLTPDRGYLIAKRDEEDLENSLLKCADEFEKFNSEALRNYAVDHFSVEAVARQFDSLYREALNR